VAEIRKILLVAARLDGGLEALTDSILSVCVTLCGEAIRASPRHSQTVLLTS
jgi:hypothetical protein